MNMNVSVALAILILVSLGRAEKWRCTFHASCSNVQCVIEARERVKNVKGMHVASDYDRILFSCNPGFMLFGPPFVGCDVWTDTLSKQDAIPTCLPITDERCRKNITNNASHYKNFNITTFHCPSNFNSSSPIYKYEEDVITASISIVVMFVCIFLLIAANLLQILYIKKLNKQFLQSRK